MARTRIGIFLLAILGAIPAARAGDDAFKKELARLNIITGSEPMRGALKALIDDKAHAKKLLEYALPEAKKKTISYNAALVLGETAGILKDMPTAETYLRICMDRGAKLQSFEKLQESYGLLIGLYYDYKQYPECARICKELLELNTDDGKERLVIALMENRRGEVEFAEPRDRFDTAERLRPYVQEIHIKAITKQGKFDQATKLVDALLKKKNDWIDLHLKGWVLKEAGKFEESADIYEDVIKQIARDDRFEARQKDRYIIQFRYEVSNVYVELKKIDRATEHLEFLIKKRPDNPGFYNDLGYIWADHDMKLEEAEKLIRKAIDLDREQRMKRPDFNAKTDHDSGAYLDSLGWVLFKQKKNKDARDWLLKATEDQSAQHIEIYDHLGDVHMVLGERDLAIKAWQKGVEVAGDSRRDQRIKSAVEMKIDKAKAAPK